MATPFPFDFTTNKNLLMGMTKPIVDDHTGTDNFTPMIRSSDAHVADDHEKAIQCLQ